MMEATEFLNQYRILNEQIRAKEEKLQIMKGHSASSMNRETIHHSFVTDRMEQDLIRIEAIQNDIVWLRIKACFALRDIAHVLDEIENTKMYG